MSSQELPRDLSIRIITQVLSHKQPLDEAIAAALVGKEITPSHRAWLQDICSGTLRWKGRIDEIIDSASLRKSPTGWLRRALMVAVYQLIGQDKVHPGQVVSETVTEIKRKEGEAPAKFANAVLRKAAEHAPQWKTLAFNPKGTAAQCAAWASLPEWFWSRLLKQKGEAWSRDFALACLERPQTWVRHKNLSLNDDRFAAGSIPGSYRLQSSGPITDLPGFTQGDFFVQDISSQILVHDVSQFVKESLSKKTPEPSALDLCAAPGGKSVGLAWNGFKVSATDRQASRIALLRQTLERVAKDQVQIIAREQVASLPHQDLVWVDAPCSGSGIVRRHPDVKWNKESDDIVSLQQLQNHLIQEGWDRVAPGGFFVYSVCSVFEEEGAQLIASHASLKNAKKTREWLLAPHLAPNGDGFWGCLLQK